jgi:hypothetical protein
MILAVCKGKEKMRENPLEKRWLSFPSPGSRRCPLCPSLSQVIRIPCFSKGYKEWGLIVKQ